MTAGSFAYTMNLLVLLAAAHTATTATAATAAAGPRRRASSCQGTCLDALCDPVSSAIKPCCWAAWDNKCDIAHRIESDPQKACEADGVGLRNGWPSSGVWCAAKACVEGSTFSTSGSGNGPCVPCTAPSTCGALGVKTACDQKTDTVCNTAFVATCSQTTEGAKRTSAGAVRSVCAVCSVCAVQ